MISGPPVRLSPSRRDDDSAIPPASAKRQRRPYARRHDTTCAGWLKNSAGNSGGNRDRKLTTSTLLLGILFAHRPLFFCSAFARARRLCFCLVSGEGTERDAVSPARWGRRRRPPLTAEQWPAQPVGGAERATARSLPGERGASPTASRPSSADEAVAVAPYGGGAGRGRDARDEEQGF